VKSCCDEHQLLPIEQALKQMKDHVECIGRIDRITLPQALDRILARDLIATLNVPAQSNSAMDGYAMHIDGATPPPENLLLIGSALAGHPFNGEVLPGTCVRITTGASIPEGANCVVMQENVEVTHLRDCQIITLRQLPCPGENVRQCGEDIAEGDVVLTKGKRLGPLDIGLIASLGIAEIDVFRRLRVAVCSTGDELTPPGESLPPGCVYDSNRYGIMALLQRLNVEVIDLGLIPDQPGAIRSAFTRAAEQADAVISSGGVSVGDADYVKEVLAELGQINFWKVAIKPGKPFAFGQMGKSYFFGLPGNPVSALVTLHQLALPILRHMAGEHVKPAAHFTAQAGALIKKRPGRADYQRGQFSYKANNLYVNTTGAQGSGVMTSFRDADCYIVLERERGSVDEHERVNVVPFDRFIQ
jgi:molybdopterin molybdotransferase